jgi:hypothetical protein
VLARALREPLVAFHHGLDGVPFHETGSLTTERAMHLLAIVAFLDPDRTVDGESVAERVVAHVEHFLRGGNEPPIRGGMYSTWADHGAAATLALVRKQPQLWDGLGVETRERADWLMRAFAVTGSFFHHADNSTRTTIDLMGSMNYLPNQRADFSSLIHAFAYFGSSGAVDNVLRQFDWSTYIDKFVEFGWVNLLTVWTRDPRTRFLFEQGGSFENQGRSEVNPLGVRAAIKVRSPYRITNVDDGSRFGDNPVVAFTPYNVFKQEADYMFGLRVTDRSTKRAGPCNAHGFTTGENRSPWSGQIGMCYEFNAWEGRSCIRYVFDGLRVHIATRANLELLGYWPDSASARELEQRMQTGVGDFFWKLQQGHFSNQRCRVYAGDLGPGFPYVEELWSALFGQAATNGAHGAQR